MLTDDEKTKIKLEETYRIEIRNEFQKEQKNSWKIIIWEVLNSAFFLWFLSSVVLTIGIKIYEDYKSNIVEKFKTKESIEKLDMEIAYRYSIVLSKLYMLTDPNSDNYKLADGYTSEDVKKTASLVKQTDGTDNSYLYTEYSRMGLLGLITEERRLLESYDKEYSKLDQPIYDISGFDIFIDVNKVKYSNVKHLAGIIESKLILQRWKEGGFYFLDGDEKNPFK